MATAASTPPAIPATALHSEFLNRVGSLPMVSSALSSAYTLYDTSKHKYQVLGDLETSIKAKVLPQLTPLVTTLQGFEPQIAQIDSFACSSLTLLERQLPIICEPPERVLESSRRVFDERVLGPVQSAGHTVADRVTRSIATATHAAP